MAKHTPGPWSVEDPMGADVGFWIVQSGLETYQWSCIAMVTGDDEDTRSSDSRFITEDEQKANARLIGAAPDMLETLQQQRAWIEHWIDDVTAGLKPTPESLSKALADIDTAIQAAGVRTATHISD